MFHNLRWWGMILRYPRTLALPSYHTVALLIGIAAVIALGQRPCGLCPQRWNPPILLFLLFFVSAFPSLPLSHYLYLFIYFSFPVASTQSCAFLCVMIEAYHLCPGWLLQFLLLPAVRFTFWVPGMIRSDSVLTYRFRMALSGRLLRPDTPQRLLPLSPLAYRRRLLGQGWSLGPEPTVIHAYEWIVWMHYREVWCTIYIGGKRSAETLLGKEGRAVLLSDRKGVERGAICV